MRGANRIRYPGSPHRKRCILVVGGFNAISDVANALSIPPGEYARKGGEAHYGLALVLGGAEVTMEELATLYAVLPGRGLLRPLRYLQSDPQVPGVRVLSDEASFVTLEMLKDNPRPDSNLASESLLNVAPVAWKTGTSYGFRDAWTAGIVGPYALLVWLGNFNGEGNPAFVGVTAAAPLLLARSIRWNCLAVRFALARISTSASAGSAASASSARLPSVAAPACSRWRREKVTEVMGCLRGSRGE